MPDTVTAKSIDDNELPETWFERNRYPVCRNIGDQWVKSGTTLLLRVPSAIIRDETNVLINPNHPEFGNVSVKEIFDFEFDKRL